MSASNRPVVQSIEDGAALGRVWQGFTEAESARVYCERWLEYLHVAHAGLRGGTVLVAGEDESPFAPLAQWPRDVDLAPYAACAQAVLDGGGERLEMLPLPDPREGVVIGAPVRVDGELCAVALFHAAAGDGALRYALRWGLAWLELLFLRRREGQPAARQDAIAGALECVAAVVDQADFQGGANALVTGLATRLECDRVSFGLVRDAGAELVAISHTALFGQKMNLVRAVEAAMDEALDQDEVVLWPPAQDKGFLVTLAHDELSQQAAESCLCTVPLVARGERVGALLLERGESRPFDARDVELADVVGSLVAAPLLDRREAERFIGALAIDRLRRFGARLLGPGHPVLKLVALMLCVAVAFLSLATGEYRIAADAVLRGAEQRAVTAPIDGYVESAPVRAGDTAAAGDTLLRLDDRELQLERLKVATEMSQLEQERKLAVASRERANAKVLDAQIEQAAARLALLDAQIERTRVAMPFDGVVVSGDFSQSLGAPVRRGDPLFEVAPAGAYRVVLDVDESQLDDVELGASGSLLLNALPDRRFALTVTRVTPVTKAREGGNYFEVEAALADAGPALRPGMRGVGKVAAGERRLAWIWTRALRAWLTLQWWRWWG